MLYSSGQMPIASDGTVPQDFRDQARLAWANIEAHLRAADMRLSSIVKHTTFLSNRRYCEANSEVRRKVLSNHEAAPAVSTPDPRPTERAFAALMASLELLDAPASDKPIEEQYEPREEFRDAMRVALNEPTDDEPCDGVETLRDATEVFLPRLAFALGGMERSGVIAPAVALVEASQAVEGAPSEIGQLGKAASAAGRTCLQDAGHPTGRACNTHSLRR